MDTDIERVPPTLAELPFFASGRFPKADLLGRCEHDRVVLISGREFVERIRDVGLGLGAIGMSAGDRVVLLSESRPEWLVLDFAILTAGARHGAGVPDALGRAGRVHHSRQ